MRKSLVLAMVAVLVCSSAVLAGVPDPTRSGCGSTGQVMPCMYRFASDGAWDKLTVCVTLRDAFDTPVPSCSTSATVSNPLAGSPPRFFCSCQPGARYTGFSGLDGVICFVIRKLGGSGQLDVNITAHCTGNIGICTESVTYSTPDLNGSCESQPASSTGVVDLGIWATGLGAYTVYSDYDCNGAVGVTDLGQWANFGLGKGCTAGL